MGVKGRAWKRLLAAGRIAKADIVAKLGSRPSKADLLDAYEALGIDAPDGATNQELIELLASAVTEV